MGLIQTTQQDYYNNNSGFGNYQFTSLEDIINQFIIAYVGESKIISKIKRSDVQFHAMRSLQELSFDTFKSTKSQEIEIPPNLSMVLPQDYVNYVKIAWVDGSGIEHTIYPTSKTSNPFSIKQNDDGTYDFDTDNDSIYDQNSLTQQGVIFKQFSPFDNSSAVLSLVFPTSNDLPTGDLEVGMFVTGSSDIPLGTTIASIDTVNNQITLSTTPTNNLLGTTDIELRFTKDNIFPTSNTANKFKGHTPSSVIDDYEDDTRFTAQGGRYGIDPQHAQDNGSFFIDELEGRVHFSSNISGKTVILKYISDSLGTDAEMQVHKFAEEAMYKCIAYAIMSTRANVQEYIVRRFQKDKFAAVRKAKLRLSSLKIEELTQILRGKSKQIKH
mgnify:FL=1